MNVLVLAGTVEARDLCGLLVAAGHNVTAALAGHTSSPAAHPCPVRIGGFGGAEGLGTHLRSAAVHVLVDATHPFSRAMPMHAVLAASAAHVPTLRLLRPPWSPVEGDHWLDVADATAAAELVEGIDGPILLTVGRLELAAFAHVAARAVVRSIEEASLPGATVLRARGPFGEAEEVRLLEDRRVAVVVTKNAGGDDAKLRAARRLGLPVVVIRRPPPLPGLRAASAGEAFALVEGLRPD